MLRGLCVRCSKTSMSHSEFFPSPPCKLSHLERCARRSAGHPCVTDRRLCSRSARTGRALPRRACAVDPKMASEAGGLQEEALRRRERLKALRERTGAARKQNEDKEAPQVKVPKSNSREEEEEEENVPKHKELKLRNYIPEDVELKERVVPNAKPASVEDKVKEQLEAAKPELIIEEVDLANLAPRKPDWDLKRDVAKKLEKLEKRTQRAIAELIRERLRGQEEELASAVDSAQQEDSDSD
ncbi:coiled-coil domain-containing protein 12 [Crotalus tigris]|uniref:coiled-coil domain-containing protein 12 n=1 Tax=Crotalus tigris TaxID=88082 RepID=UPI00192F9546|nr:coiled-coil domain-containing protein 12 [Crotalus tigris]